MWIRDALPYDLTINNQDTSGIGRVMIYGYESTVEGAIVFRTSRIWRIRFVIRSFHLSILQAVVLSSPFFSSPTV
jgi:hypothetical protein